MNGRGMNLGSYSPSAVYDRRIKTLGLRLKRLKKRGTALGIIKLVLILGALLALFQVFFQNPTISLGLFGLALVLFTTGVVIHESLIRMAKRLKALNQLNENERKFLNHEFPLAAPFGEEFQNPDHPYTADLDIFGKKSLFQYVNRAVTPLGRRCLAGWLQSQADPDEVKGRQQAVLELSPRIDLRQSIASHGIFIEDAWSKLDSIYEFFAEPFFLLDKKWLPIFLWIWPLLTLGAAALIIIKIHPAVFGSMVLSQLALNGLFSKRIEHLHGQTSQNWKLMKACSRLIADIEAENFAAEKLMELKNRLTADEKKASECIRHFSRLLEWFDARKGMLHILFNNILLWDLHCVYRLEKWRKQTAGHVPQWFNAIGEFEALSGLAALRFNYPQWAMPEIRENSFRLEAQNLGHPLIPEKERVCSSFELGENGGEAAAGSLAVVTGPNMAGKSTFLKAIGLNTVLAFAGAPVCAERWVISPVKLMTSMKTSDSLDRHMSLFYAELQRLKMILDGISRREPVFFLIDEMLKGTNVLDRQKGSVALLKQMMRGGANGIVATHDLELTKLGKAAEWENFGSPSAQEIPVANYHFDGHLEGDKLLFDFRLKPGVCVSHNALLLMKRIGIDVQDSSDLLSRLETE